MADYKYLGLTTYIKENDDNTAKFRVLAEAIDALSLSNGMPIDTDEPVDIRFENIMQSKAFKQIYDEDFLCSPDASELPSNMPAGYDRPIIESVEIKGHNLNRIYIPAVAKNELKIHDFIYNALQPVLLELFGDDIISMKTKESIEFEAFQDGAEKTLMSAK